MSCCLFCRGVGKGEVGGRSGGEVTLYADVRLFCVRIIAANIPECEFLNVIELLGQLFYILAQLFLGNLGVHLRGLDVFVTKHGTYCFYWYTIGEANRGCERVP